VLVVFLDGLQDQLAEPSSLFALLAASRFLLDFGRISKGALLLRGVFTRSQGLAFEPAESCEVVQKILLEHCRFTGELIHLDRGTKLRISRRPSVELAGAVVVHLVARSRGLHRSPRSQGMLP